MGAVDQKQYNWSHHSIKDQSNYGCRVRNVSDTDTLGF